jgi:zinc protease
VSIGIALTTGQTIEDVESWPDRISAVTLEQVNAAARHVLHPARSVTSLLLPDDPGARPRSSRRERSLTGRAPKEQTR